MTEDMTINNLGFTELPQTELMLIDGGFSWEGLGETISTTAGGYIGSQIGAKVGSSIGTSFGPVGTVAGGLIGAGAGYILYNLFD